MAEVHHFAGLPIWTYDLARGALTCYFWLQSAEARSKKLQSIERILWQIIPRSPVRTGGNNIPQHPCLGPQASGGQEQNDYRMWVSIPYLPQTTIFRSILQVDIFRHTRLASSWFNTC